MPEDVTTIIAEVRDVSDEADRRFGRLTPEQLNWRPAPESWGVAQCLEHLIAMNADFFPVFDAIARAFREAPNRRLLRLPHHINDPAFAEAAVAALTEIDSLRGRDRHAAL